MHIDKWMDTEIVVHIYNGILLSYKKEYIWVSPNEVDESRAYYTELVSQKEKDKYCMEKTLESPLDCKEIQPVHSKGNQTWVFFGRNDANAETPVLWPPHAKSWLIGKDWCWEGLGAGGKGDDRGWDGWMVSPTRWTWVWVNSGSWWWIGRPDVLKFMGSQRVGHNWATELNWTELNTYIWNLKRWNWWTYLPGSNGNADKYNSLVDTVGEGERGTNCEDSMET